MPLIINELLTHIESPADHATQPATATGSDDAEQQVMEALALSMEREERLKIY